MGNLTTTNQFFMTKLPLSKFFGNCIKTTVIRVTKFCRCLETYIVTKSVGRNGIWLLLFGIQAGKQH